MKRKTLPQYIIKEDEDNEGYRPSSFWKQYLEENRLRRMNTLQRHPEIVDQLKATLGIAGCWSGIPSYDPPEASHSYYYEPEPVIRGFDFADAFNYAYQANIVTQQKSFAEAATAYREMMA